MSCLLSTPINHLATPQIYPVVHVDDRGSFTKEWFFPFRLRLFPSLSPKTMQCFTRNKEKAVKISIILVPGAEHCFLLISLKVTISQHLGGNGSYCSRPLLNPSHWDSADWMRLSPVNYGHTHLLWKKLASFIFQWNKKNNKNNKAWHQRAWRIWSWMRVLRWSGCILALRCLMLFEMSQCGREKGKWSGRWQGAAPEHHG